MQKHFVTSHDKQSAAAVAVDRNMWGSILANILLHKDIFLIFTDRKLILCSDITSFHHLMSSKSIDYLDQCLNFFFTLQFHLMRAKTHIQMILNILWSNKSCLSVKTDNSRHKHTRVHWYETSGGFITAYPKQERFEVQKRKKANCAW